MCLRFLSSVTLLRLLSENGRWSILVMDSWNILQKISIIVPGSVLVVKKLRIFFKHIISYLTTRYLKYSLDSFFFRGNLFALGFFSLCLVTSSYSKAVIFTCFLFFLAPYVVYVLSFQKVRFWSCRKARWMGRNVGPRLVKWSEPQAVPFGLLVFVDIFRWQRTGVEKLAASGLLKAHLSDSEAKQKAPNLTLLKSIVTYGCRSLIVIMECFTWWEENQWRRLPFKTKTEVTPI